MPGFVYYLPTTDRTQCNIEALRECGLAYAFEDRSLQSLVMRGPDGQQGHVVGDPRLVQENAIGYFESRQRWLKIPEGLPGSSAKAWVGYSTDCPLRPEDLKRETQLHGHWVRLADGQKWLVPIARKSMPTDEQPLRYCVALPHVAGIDDQGQWTTGNVLARYAPLWQVAMTFWTAMLSANFTEEDQATLQFGDSLDAATLALCANYRIGKVEATLLGLFTLEHAVTVLQALVDWPTARDWFKKKQAADDGSITASGPPAEIPVISPPAPIAGPSL